MSDLHNTILISTGIVASLPLIPVGQYLRFGWSARKQQIVSRLVIFYKATFCPNSDFADSAGFAKEYDVRYGRPLFLFPVLLLSATLFFSTYLGVSWVFSHDWLGESEEPRRLRFSRLRALISRLPIT